MIDVYIVYHSDGAVNSYTTGTEMKDTYRADVDIHHLACCRPESVYHPDKLQTCIVCRHDTGQPHGTCPLVLYPRPEKHLGEHPYMGPRPAVKECSEYSVCFIVYCTWSSCRRKTVVFYYYLIN